MNSIKVLIFAFAAVVAIAEVQGGNLACPQICPDLLDPVCGTDESQYVKFENNCELIAFNCNRQRSALSTYRTTDLDWCTTTELNENMEMFRKDIQEADVTCMKPCPMILRPVCGSNGTYRKTFSNDCEMDMFTCVHRHQRKNGWRLLKSSSCS